MSHTDIQIGQIIELKKLLESGALSDTVTKKLSAIIRYYESGSSLDSVAKSVGVTGGALRRWHDQFDPSNISSLEEKSRKPKTLRISSIDPQVSLLIRQYRMSSPRIGKEEISQKLHDDHAIEASASAIGRIIERDCLYFADCPLHRRKRYQSQVEKTPTGENVVMTQAENVVAVSIPVQSRWSVLRKWTVHGLLFALLVCGTILGMMLTTITRAHAATLSAKLLVNSEAFDTIDVGDGTSDIGLRFGSSTNSIQFLTTGIFRFSSGISVHGNMSGSSLTVDQDANISGSILVKSNLTARGTISGTTINANTLLTGSTLQGFGLYNCQGTSNKLTYNSTTRKFLCEADQTGGAGSQEVGTASFSGATLRLGDARYVKKQGDAMTGALTIDVTGGNNATIGLKVINTISGSVIHAEKSLTSSGILTVKGNASVKGTLSGANLTYMGATSSYILGNLGVGTTAPQTKLEVLGTVSGTTLQAKATNNLTVPSIAFSDAPTTGMAYDAINSVLAMVVDGSSIFKISTGVVNGTYSVGPRLNFGSSADQPATPAYSFAGDVNTGLYTGAPDTLSVAAGENQIARFHTSGLSVLGTLSGTTVNANTLLTGSTLQGFGLYNCQGTSNKLTYDATTKKFLCEADQTGGGPGTEWSNTGSLMNAFDLRYVKKSGDTMTGALDIRTSAVLATRSGALNIHQFGNGTGAIIRSLSSVAPALALEVDGSSRSPHVLFGYQGTFDTNLFRSAVATLRTDGSFIAQNTLSGTNLIVSNRATVSGALVVKNGITAKSLTLTSTISGATISLSKATNRILAVTGALVWYVDGTLATGNQQSITWTMPFNFTPNSVKMNVKTAPTGAAIIVNIKEGGSTIFSTKPQINAGSTIQASNEVFSDTSLAKGSIITLDIDQVGSTIAGESISVMLYGTYDM